MIGPNVRYLFIAEYEAAQGWIAGNISRFKTSVRQDDFYLLYKIGRRPLPPPGIEMVIQSLGKQVRIVDATQIRDEEMIQHIVSEIKSASKISIEIWFLQMKEEFDSVKNQLPEYTISYAETFQVGRRGKKAESQTKEEPHKKENNPSGSPPVRDNEEKAPPLPQQQVKQEVQSGKKQKKRRNSKKPEQRPRQSSKNPDDNSSDRSSSLNQADKKTEPKETAKQTEPEELANVAAGRHAPKEPETKKSGSKEISGFDMADIFDSFNLFGTGFPKSTQTQKGSDSSHEESNSTTTTKPDSVSMESDSASSEPSPHEESITPEGSEGSFEYQPGTTGKETPSKEPAAEKRVSNSSDRKPPAGSIPSPQSSFRNGKGDSGKGRSEKSAPKETSTADLMRIIFGARHDERSYQHDFTELENSKAQMVSKLEERLIQNINLLVKGVKDYDWDYPEYMQFIVTMIRSSDYQDFLESWSIVSPNHQIQITEDVYKAIFDETEYYSRVCDLLYAEDNW